MAEVIKIDLNDEYMMDRVRGLNDSYIDRFRRELAPMNPQEISLHLMNADYFINDYLLGEFGESVEGGLDRISQFLSFDYITGYIWSTPESLRKCAYSIELFYESMAEHEVITDEELRKMNDIIEDNIEKWMDVCRRYNDPDAENPFGDME